LSPPTSATPNRLSVYFDLNQNDVFEPGETVIDIPNLSVVNGAVPSTFKFGFAAATGGSTVDYTITTQNIGPSAAESVTITDSIIPGLTGVTASNGGIYDAVTGIVTWTAVAIDNKI